MTKNEAIAKARALTGFFRKPLSWGDVGQPVPLELLENLKQYTSMELGINYNIAGRFRVQPEDPVFLVGHNGGVYLVLSEGSNYVRYIRYVGTLFPAPPLSKGMNTRDYVLAALHRSGYYDDHKDILWTKYVGVTQKGQEIHSFGFIGDDGTEQEGSIYVWVGEDGQKRADF